MFLIVGGDSEIGGEAFRVIRASGLPVAATTRRHDRIAADRPFLDLAQPLEAWEAPPGTTAVCVCAAVARMAACAADPNGTAYINVYQTLSLLERLVARGIYVLFLSTNQVFDGHQAHVPVDAAYSPVSEYGRQKVRTEAALRDHMTRGAPAAVLRLAKVISSRMPLLDGWIANLSTGQSVDAFSDMMLAPTPTDVVCAAISALLKHRAVGIFQLTGPRDVAYAEVARFLTTLLGAPSSLVRETSARSTGLPEGATPLNTTLDSTMLRQQFGLQAPDVWEVIKQAVATTTKIAC